MSTVTASSETRQPVVSSAPVFSHGLPLIITEPVLFFGGKKRFTV